MLGWFGFYHIVSLTSQLGRAGRRGGTPAAPRAAPPRIGAGARCNTPRRNADNLPS
jgi:hypothetical protein